MSKQKETPKFQINLKSFDYKILDASVKEIKDLFEQVGAFVAAIPLPTKTVRLTLLTSPHVDKKSREQYECKTYKRSIMLYTSGNKALESRLDDTFKSYTLKPGVHLNLKTK